MEYEDYGVIIFGRYVWYKGNLYSYEELEEVLHPDDYAVLYDNLELGDFIVGRNMDLVLYGIPEPWKII